MNNQGKEFLLFSILHYNSSLTNAYIIFFPFCLSCTANMDFCKGSGWCCNLFWSLLFSFSEKQLWCCLSQISIFLRQSWSKHCSHMEEKKFSHRRVSYLYVTVEWIPLHQQSSYFRNPEIWYLIFLNWSCWAYLMI